MSHISDLIPDTPELRRTLYPTTRVAGAIPISLSDSEPEPDFDVDVIPPPIFEPHFSDDDSSRHREHHHDVSFMDDFFDPETLSSDPNESNLDPYFVPDWTEHERCGSGVNLELGLGFGLGSSSQSNCDETRRFEGLRPINLDSDSNSDSDDGVLHDFDYDFNSVRNNNNRNLGFGGVSDFDRPPFCWDYLGFNNRNHDHVTNINDINEPNERGTNNNDDGDDNDNDNDEFLYDGGDEDNSVVIESDSVDVDAGVSVLFDAYQEREEQREIAIESDDDDGGVDLGVDDAIRDLEWEILMAVNNFNREVYDMDFSVDMYEAILGEMEERLNECRGTPPASLTVIENLPIVKLSSDGGSKENEVVCAICRDDVLGEEVVRQLPCLHYYHGDCIFPWLKIRNTCPVCRFELPTDDAEYEFRKREREGFFDDAIEDNELTLDSQSQVSYDFHVFL